MSSFRSLFAITITITIAAAGWLAAGAVAAKGDAYPGIGRAATASEVAAWDIDVRPDFLGLPAGSGTVARGQDVWEAKCASCHGVFGESNEIFSPLVGGTTADDVASGRVRRLTDAAYPGRTTLMKVGTVSTLWDYIRRAMPWNAPKSLTTDEVYAVTAFLLNLGGVLPDDYTLSNATIADAQQRMPNRNGFTTGHALWPGRTPVGRRAPDARPDVQAAACMKGCATEAAVKSMLPDFARNAHGNLAEQNRSVGAQHGADTAHAAGAAPAAAAATVALTAAVTAPPDNAPAAAQALALARKHNCLSCHGLDSKIVGPALRDVARKVAARADAAAYLAQKIRAGGSGVWGPIPMPAQALPDADIRAIAQWLADGAK